MSRDEFFAFKFAVLIQVGATFLVVAAIDAIFPGLLHNTHFAWSLSLLLLTYLLLTVDPLARLILPYLKRERRRIEDQAREREARRRKQARLIPIADGREGYGEAQRDEADVIRRALGAGSPAEAQGNQQAASKQPTSKLPPGST